MKEKRKMNPIKTPEELLREIINKRLGDPGTVKYEHHIHQEIAVEAIKVYHDQFELSDKDIKEAFTKESYHYEIGRHYKVLKDRIFGAKWYKEQLKKTEK
jgi:hypothetical protein